jgi:hypothetical protein
MVKARIEFVPGWGWTLRTDTAIQTTDTFSEACNAFQQRRNTEAIQACLDKYQARMGQIQTLGRA